MACVKCQYSTTTQRCVISQKSADLIHSMSKNGKEIVNYIC
jgi:hypothetical protein